MFKLKAIFKLIPKVFVFVAVVIVVWWSKQGSYGKIESNYDITLKDNVFYSKGIEIQRLMQSCSN